IFIYVMTSKASLGSGNRQFLDEYLYHLAKEKNKEVIGLETIEEQVSALESITIREQFDMILKNIDKQQKESKSYAKMLKVYRKQDLDGLLQMLKKSSFSEVSYRQLIIDRNHTMTERMIPLMKKNIVFVAVGAGHLPGAEG